jgi:hypothetical protein
VLAVRKIVVDRRPLPASGCSLLQKGGHHSAGDMDREGLSRVRRAELLARLAALDRMIEEQTSRVELIRKMGSDVTLIEKRLTLLKESRQLYLKALFELLGGDFADDDAGDGGSGVPPAGPSAN